MIKFIDNIGDYFSSNFFDEDFVTKVADKSGLSADSLKEIGRRFTAVKEKYFRYKQNLLEGGLRIKDKIYETHKFNSSLLEALDYDAKNTNYDTPYHLSEDDVLPVRHILYRGDQPYLFVLEMQPLIRKGDKDPDGLFEQRYNVEQETVGNPPQKYHRSQWERVFKLREGLKISPVVINKAVSELFLIEQHQRPKYVLLLAGNVVFLLEQEKWFRGSYLKFDLEELFDEATVDRKYYSLFYLLLSKEMLAPQSNMVLMDQLDEDSHKSAYEVTQDLKEGIIHAVEALANEALYYKKTVLREDFDETDDDFEQQVKDDCLTIIYRLLFIFYAESREDLDILPMNDTNYERGYSLEMLRDLEQVPMHSESSRNGYFFHNSLTKLFTLLSSGYRENENESNRSFKVRHIDSPLFNNKRLHYLGKVKFRNWVWQDIVCELSLSKQQNRKARGRISYANLGINQLGSVYESLLAYRGFFAEQDYIEVHKANKPEEGTYLVPRSRRDDFEEDEILKDKEGTVKIIEKGKFIYRLSGRDRQKSASYYTPEVLTQCTVKYTLKPILEKVSKGEMKATELLELKLLEPAMGAAAFHNEMINQLAEAYLNYRQEELKKANRKEWKLQPDKYREELQKVKAYIATHNVYGVDLNPTAIELGKLSLWLNVIHKDMETPFFSNRLGVGNAVVGAWLKVYKEKDLNEEYEIVKDKKGKDKKQLIKKEWWEKAPTLVPIQGSIKRKENEIYHFLLPDKNMIASAEIGLLKQEYSKEVARAREIKKEWLQPLTATELQRLKNICKKIDGLLKDYYEFQQRINALTSNKQDVWGIFDKVQQRNFGLKNFEEKERLADERNRHNAPYFKLKMIMDYWCSLWFWDVREALHLPTRALLWKDIEDILAVDVEDKFKTLRLGQGKQQRLYETAVQTKLALAEGEELESEEVQEVTNDLIIEDVKKKDLFDDNFRLKLIKHLSCRHRYFHPQLEFFEVFWERGGFDVIAGNPPWLKIEFEEKNILSEKKPEVFTRSVSASEVRKLRSDLLNGDEETHNAFYQEFIEITSLSAFLGSLQNYKLTDGQSQAANLYKAIIENTFTTSREEGFIGLVHPEGIFEDPKGQSFRREVYRRLRFHFQFKNELALFPEVHHETIYSCNVYSGKRSVINFTSIHNLFHPATIDNSIIHDGQGLPGGIKKLNAQTNKMNWNLEPHKDRVVLFQDSELLLLSETFENHSKLEEVKLVSIHTIQILRVLHKLRQFKGKVENHPFYITDGWRETDAINAGLIKRETKVVSYDDYELIITGPHFYVSNPFYKTPRRVSKLNSDYDAIDLSTINGQFAPRTNFLPVINIEKFKNRFIWEAKQIRWIDQYKIAFSKMLSISGERTLQPAIISPKVSHTSSVISIIFESKDLLTELVGLSSSIVVDFFIKTLGRGNLYESSIKMLPLGVDSKFKQELFMRTLVLNCLDCTYADLWGVQQTITSLNWSKNDKRLLSISLYERNWNYNVALRTAFERRQALIEIDVITSMAFGLTLEELVLIYNVQFAVLQQNEDDTWYDQKGNIVFTCSKGLTGVGVDRPVWETIRHLKEGETYEHTITKSELYYGKKVTYYAPFDKCDRVEDYKIAWAHFEKVFVEK